MAPIRPTVTTAPSSESLDSAGHYKLSFRNPNRIFSVADTKVWVNYRLAKSETMP